MVWQSNKHRTPNCHKATVVPSAAMILGRRGAECKGRERWSCAVEDTVLMTLLLLLLQFSVICTGLEVITSVVDRDGDSLHIEDILEGYGSAPVSVEFSPVSPHMFMGFKAGAVRIYPEGADTDFAEQFYFCFEMEDQVRVAAYIFQLDEPCHTSNSFFRMKQPDRPPTAMTVITASSCKETTDCRHWTSSSKCLIYCSLIQQIKRTSPMLPDHRRFQERFVLPGAVFNLSNYYCTKREYDASSSSSSSLTIRHTCCDT